MKKQFVSLLVLSLATSFFLFSCDNKAKRNTGTLEFDSIQVNTTEHLFGDTAKPACNLVINFAYVTQADDKVMKDSLNQYFQRLCFGDSTHTTSPQKAVENYRKQYVSNYRNDLEELYQKEEKEFGDADQRAWFSYYKYIQSHIQFYRKDLLAYRTRYEEYTGGAHGIYMTSFLNLDLRTLSPVHLNDLFAEGYEEALTDLLWNQLMADNRVTTRKELEDLGYGSTGDLTPTENFCIGPKGITFLYNVYEIAPYVMGAIEITLPYEIMSHLLNDKSKILDSVK
ncbi:MAG TPA: DUF3298 and DUF4163 domain-containing protein [Candidatus Bacteroides merdipullorum]|uniref:DUF3298 and DUF4163 domain-containing protein n=1 Tax=Candidatus Bacteroides merdipullorum TaxID=2838474 RepID=A0A9D2CV09_9BACE|nr:DUF3298 and DUF4163 domain-containing protein [Candidatus Bacteroides merdipullorum]